MLVRLLSCLWPFSSHISNADSLPAIGDAQQRRAAGTAPNSRRNLYHKLRQLGRDRPQRRGHRRCPSRTWHGLRILKTKAYSQRICCDILAPRLPHNASGHVPRTRPGPVFGVTCDMTNAAVAVASPRARKHGIRLTVPIPGGRSSACSAISQARAMLFCAAGTTPSTPPMPTVAADRLPASSLPPVAAAAAASARMWRELGAGLDELRLAAAKSSTSSSSGVQLAGTTSAASRRRPAT
jgi:hypothetical protein